MTVSRWALWPGFIVTLFALFLSVACGPKHVLAPRFQTFGELRAVRGDVRVAEPGQSPRGLYPRERLVDGAQIQVPAGGLAWLRPDGGTTLLIRGPARVTFGKDDIDVQQGRLFVDSPGERPTQVTTPQGELSLARVRASLEVADQGAGTEVYVLTGEVRTDAGAHAGPGEQMRLEGAVGAIRSAVRPAVAWIDWTGGLATTDRSAEPPPFGVGMVGARRPGAAGLPRLPLSIQRMDVRVTVDGDLAVTEVDQVFFNGTSETVEGMYLFRTPQNAVLTRFGVDREGVLVWGRVKEKAQAAAQYQKNVYEGSREDPALLEWDSPGVYKARLYPILPGQGRRVVVRYSEWLPRTGPRGARRLYVFPMAAEGPEESLPRIEFFRAEFDLRRAGAKEVRTGMHGVVDGGSVVVREHDLIPRADLALELYDDGLTGLRGAVAPHGIADELLLPSERAQARERARSEADYVFVPVRADDMPTLAGGLDLILVVDTSAATEASSLAVARAAVGAVLAHLGSDDRALVWAGDVSLRPVAPGWTSLKKLDDAGRQAVAIGLASIDRGGATDLGGMIAQAAAQLDPARRGAIVYVGDGRPTVGELAVADLRARLAKLPRPVRVFSLGVGEDADMGVLQGVSRGGFAERVTDAASAARVALHLLEMAERPAWLGVGVDLGTSVERIFPRDLDTLVAGETALLVGRASGTLPTRVKLTTPAGTREIPVELRRITDDGDLRLRWAGQRLAQMLDEGTGRAALVDLGVRSGIITPFTSLYVPTKREMSPEEREELERKRRRLKASIQNGAASQVAFGATPTMLGMAGCSKLASRSDEGSPAAAAEQAPPADVPVAAIPQAPSKDDQVAEGEDKPSAGPTKGGGARAKAAAEPDNEVASKETGEARDESLGSEPLDARGDMRGDDVADSLGRGGLGLSGIGGGGGGLGTLGTTGHGAGTGTGQGFGAGAGRLGGSHRSSSPQIRPGATTVSGRLPAEVVQRIVRQNFGRFRMCYEDGLRNNPNLQGRVTVRFVIGSDGSVGRAANAGSDLPDAAVVQCVVGAFRGLSFPQPEGGSVSVVYPLLLSPGDGGAGATDKGADKGGVESGEKAKTDAGSKGIRVRVVIEPLPHALVGCSATSSLPLEERVAVWRELLSKCGGNPAVVAQEYANAIARCEAPTWRERSRLLSLMLNVIPTVKARVELWRLMRAYPSAADALYRGIMTRVRGAKEMRELHDALGLKQMDPGVLEKLLRETKEPSERVKKLRALALQWPDDFGLALRLGEALEDAGDDAGARDLARRLRARPDADAHVRAELGELYLRIAARCSDKAQAALDQAEARRAFGEIVEYAPEDPIARRRLGDLLRAHGWYEDAARQYETLARLSPDDTSTQLLLAASAEGLGKLEESVRWLEKLSDAGAPDELRGLGRTARAMAAAFLAWGREAARKEGKRDQVDSLLARSARLMAKDDRSPASARVVLIWAHPELHPTLWSNAAGGMMPAPEGDATLGVAQVILPLKPDAAVEVRVEPSEVEHAARLGAEAMLTVIFDEGGAEEKVVVIPVRFAKGGSAVLHYNVAGKEVKP